jgi:phosphoribosylanthranilate isomerase
MIQGIHLKVCGLTSMLDAAFAERRGADHLGFILYPDSPRYVPLEKFRALAGSSPKGKRVAVSVAPAIEDLRAFQAAGADFFQIHFPQETPLDTVRAWSETVGPANLWLAPRLAPAADVPEALLPLAGVFLLDTFSPDKFGGTGKTGDWAKFARHRKSYPDKTWILSGGLNPHNIAQALAESGARWIDVNSGVESAPGVKDHAKIEAFVRGLRV